MMIQVPIERDAFDMMKARAELSKLPSVQAVLALILKDWMDQQPDLARYVKLRQSLRSAADRQALEQSGLAIERNGESGV